MKYKGAILEYIPHSPRVIVELPKCKRKLRRSSMASGKRLVNLYLDYLSKIDTPQTLPSRWLKESEEDYLRRCRITKQLTLGERGLYSIGIGRKDLI